MNNKSDESLFGRVKDIFQQAGKSILGLVVQDDELNKEARRNAEIRINEIIKRLSSGNLSATEIQDLIREGKELIQNFPGLSVAAAFSSVASQVGGTSAGLAQSQLTAASNAIEIKNDKTISLGELFDFHPDIIKAEEENKKLKNRFDAIKRDPPNEESIKATREGLDDSRDDKYVINYVETQKKSLQVMHKEQEYYHSRVHEHKEHHHIGKLEQIEKAIINHTEECVEHLKDIFKIRKVASQLGDKPASELDDKKILECRENFEQAKLSQTEDKEIGNVFSQDISINGLKSLLNSTAPKQSINQPPRENQSLESGKWVRKVSLEKDSNEKGKNGSGDNNKDGGGRGGRS